MTIALKVAYNVAVIFLYIILGFTLSKAKKLTDIGAKQITNILLILVTPCVLINAYQEKIDSFSPSLLEGLLTSAFLSIIIHIIAITISALTFMKKKDGSYKVSTFASIYSNCGFMAIPILQSVLGSDGVFYGSAYLAVFTIFYWTHGVIVYTGKKDSISLKSLFLNPGVLGTFIAIGLFIFKFKLPGIISYKGGEISELSLAVQGMASLNTPLSMLVLGSYLARVNLKKALSNIHSYIVCFLRLILIPLVVLFFLFVLKRLLEFDSLIVSSVLIPASCPVATVSVMFAAKFDSDVVYASEIVAISTLFSIVTIPLIMYISSFFII